MAIRGGIVNFTLLMLRSRQFETVKECGPHFVLASLGCNVKTRLCFVFFLICREILI